MTCEEVLDEEVDDPTAKRFFKVDGALRYRDSRAAYTNGLNALKNFADGCRRLYRPVFDPERQRAADRVPALRDRRRHRSSIIACSRSASTDSGRYQLNMMNGKGPETRDFDLVLMCLPHTWLATMRLGRRAAAHVDGQACRLFRPPGALPARRRSCSTSRSGATRSPAPGSCPRAFGGCCVYIEGARHDVGKHGVLNWLIAGSDALAFANLSRPGADRRRARSRCRPALGNAREHFIEGKIHRWLSSVNAIPGGLPVRDVMTNHRAGAEGASGHRRGRRLFVRFARSNGLLDSSDAATDIILTEMMRLRRASAAGGKPHVRQDRSRLFRQLSRPRPLQREPGASLPTPTI